jgi:hypothetical protein
MPVNQPEALRLADELESDPQTNRFGFVIVAARELRHLHKANQAMLEALKWIADQTYDPWSNGAEAQRHAIAAIAKWREE